MRGCEREKTKGRINIESADKATAAMASMQLSDEAETLKLQGNEFFKQKRWADAAKKYRLATEIEPTCAVYWSNLALCYHKMNLYTEMQAAAVRCYANDKNSAKAYYYLALSSLKMMKYEHAMSFAVEGLKIHPRHKELSDVFLSIENAMKRKEMANQFVLKGNQDKKLSYYGGLPSSRSSLIPEGTAYSRLERTSLPILSKKTAEV